MAQEVMDESTGIYGCIFKIVDTAPSQSNLGRIARNYCFFVTGIIYHKGRSDLNVIVNVNAEALISSISQYFITVSCHDETKD